MKRQEIKEGARDWRREREGKVRDDWRSDRNTSHGQKEWCIFGKGEVMNTAARSSPPFSLHPSKPSQNQPVHTLQLYVHTHTHTHTMHNYISAQRASPKSQESWFGARGRAAASSGVSAPSANQLSFVVSWQSPPDFFSREDTNFCTQMDQINVYVHLWAFCDECDMKIGLSRKEGGSSETAKTACHVHSCFHTHTHTHTQPLWEMSAS